MMLTLNPESAKRIYERWSKGCAAQYTYQRENVHQFIDHDVARTWQQLTGQNPNDPAKETKIE